MDGMIITDGQTDRQTDRQMDVNRLRTSWSKKCGYHGIQRGMYIATVQAFALHQNSGQSQQQQTEPS